MLYVTNTWHYFISNDVYHKYRIIFFICIFQNVVWNKNWITRQHVILSRNLAFGYIADLKKTQSAKGGSFVGLTCHLLFSFLSLLNNLIFGDTQVESWRHDNLKWRRRYIDIRSTVSSQFWSDISIKNIRKIPRCTQKGFQLQRKISWSILSI